MAHNLPPGCYAVIFISQLAADHDGYEAMAAEMVALVQSQPGFLGFDSVRGEEGGGITVSYWESLAAIEAWHGEPRHQRAQQRGRSHWYDSYTIHVTRLERSRRFRRGAKEHGD